MTSSGQLFVLVCSDWMVHTIHCCWILKAKFPGKSSKSPAPSPNYPHIHKWYDTKDPEHLHYLEAADTGFWSDRYIQRYEDETSCLMLKRSLLRKKSVVSPKFDKIPRLDSQLEKCATFTKTKIPPPPLPTPHTYFSHSKTLQLQTTQTITGWNTLS